MPYEKSHNRSIYLLKIIISPFDLTCISFLHPFFIATDVDTFISDVLKGENLSKRAKEKRDALIKKIKDIKST